MNVRSSKEVTYVLTFTEREAKMLGCLIGALSPLDTGDWIKKGLNYSKWLGTVDTQRGQHIY